MASIDIVSSWYNVEEELADVSDECRKAGVSISVRRPEYAGIDATFVVGVLGGVSGFIIARLIEAVLTRIVGPPGRISVTDRQKGVSFRFPEERDACLEHFGASDGGVGVGGWVFVSHASEDDKLIRDQILPLLYKSGNRPWYSYYEITTAEDWERRILAGLRISEWFLVALSKNATASSWVRSEVHWAMENRRGKIIPLLLDECSREDLHLGLLPIQYIDFREDRMQVEAALQQVLGNGPCK
ncbi:MAG TPA: toll/interleukin-1 receptor domain-containing protein [Polyangiaceae bacterium]